MESRNDEPALSIEDMGHSKNHAWVSSKYPRTEPDKNQKSANKDMLEQPQSNHKWQFKKSRTMNIS